MRLRLSHLLVSTLVFPLLALGQTVPAIYDSSYGYRLPGPAECPVWWCEATYKVGRTRAVPTATADAVEIAAARNEYEPFQIVLRPGETLSNVTVTVSDFVQQGNDSPARIAATNVEICLLDYVPVATPSDDFGTNGLHPDPLLPLTGFFDLAVGTNQPLWFTVYVPKDVPAGVYVATVTISADSPITVPVRLRVFNFALSDVTHTRTAYYVDVDVDPTWHRLSTLAQKREVWDLYMQNFRKHRVSPYSAHLYAPIAWSLVNGEFSVDFRDFDAAMARYLDEFGFNAFNIFGHKSPSFPSSLGGYAAFSPQWRQLFTKLMLPIQAHLREKGWMDRAYCYWMDEPLV